MISLILRIHCSCWERISGNTLSFNSSMSSHLDISSLMYIDSNILTTCSSLSILKSYNRYEKLFSGKLYNYIRTTKRLPYFANAECGSLLFPVHHDPVFNDIPFFSRTQRSDHYLRSPSPSDLLRQNHPVRLFLHTSHRN